MSTTSYASSTRRGTLHNRLTAAEIGQLAPVLRVGLLGEEGKLSPRSQRPQTAKSLRMLGSVYTATLHSLDSQQAGYERPSTATTLRSTTSSAIPRPPTSSRTHNPPPSTRPSSSRRREDDVTMGIERDDTDDVCDKEMDAAFASKAASSRSAGRSRPWASSSTYSRPRSATLSAATSRRPPSAAAVSERTCSGVAGISTPRNEERPRIGGASLSSQPPFYSSFKHGSISRYLAESKKLVFSDSVDRMKEYVQSHQEALEIAKQGPLELPHVEEYSRTAAQQKRQELLASMQKEYMKRQEVASQFGSKGGCQPTTTLLSPQVESDSMNRAHSIFVKRAQTGSVKRLNAQSPTTLIAKKIRKDFLYGHPIRPGGVN